MEKKVKLDLTRVSGNAFAVMGAFSSAALRQGWTQDEIDNVLEDAMSDDYDHLLATILDNVEDDD